MRILTIEGKVTISKALTVFKIIHLPLQILIPVTVIKEPNKIHKEFIWRCKNTKIKQSILRSKYENQGLKSVDVSLKIKSLKFFWIKRLYDNKFHEWKSILLLLMNTYLRKNLKFNLIWKCHIGKLNNFPIISKRFWKTGGGGRSSLPLLGNWKKYPNLGGKCPDCWHLCHQLLLHKFSNITNT